MVRVVLTTTMWEDVKREDGEEREDELKSKFWKSMMDDGATVDRLKVTDHDEAWRVVDLLIEKCPESSREALLLQKELVDLRLKLKDTKAGKRVHPPLHELLSGVHKELKKLMRLFGSSNVYS
jgi:hypothetical protein